MINEDDKRRTLRLAVAMFETDEERRAVLGALKGYRNRLAMALRANARKGWTPAPGRIDANAARLKTVNMLIARWHRDEEAR